MKNWSMCELALYNTSEYAILVYLGSNKLAFDCKIDGLRRHVSDPVIQGVKLQRCPAFEFSTDGSTVIVGMSACTVSPPHHWLLELLPWAEAL